MKKLTKLIGLLGISSGSLFFNPGYSQEKEYSTEKGTFSKGGTYVVDGKTYSIKYESIDDKGRTWTRYGNVDKKNPTIITNYSSWIIKEPKTENYNMGKYGTYNIKEQYKDKQGVTRVTNYSNTNTNKNVYIPPKKDEINWDKTIGNAILIGGGILLLNELFKPRNKVPVDNSPPVNNPPINYNSNPGKSNVDWWKEDKEKNKNSGGNWWEDKTSQVKKTENTNWWEDAQQKKADAKIQAEKTSKELSDFVEKQAGYSPETKIWFDEKAKEADEFYKEFYKNDPEAYAETLKKNKLEKVIGYEAYQIGKNYTPAGPVIEGVEKYDEIKEKGVENYWKEEVKEADEFLKQYESNPELKSVLDEKRLEEIINKDVYIQKIEKDKYSEQINKIAYESDVSKVIRYRAYQYAKNHTEAGTVIKGVEKYEEKKESTGWWDK